MSLPKSCLYPSCDGRVTKRGLCTKHYFRAYREVQRGRATWSALIAQKKASERRCDTPDDAWFVTAPKKAPEDLAVAETPEASESTKA